MEGEVGEHEGERRLAKGRSCQITACGGARKKCYDSHVALLAL